LKDLNKVHVVQEEEEDDDRYYFNSSNDRRYNLLSSGPQQQRRNYGSSHHQGGAGGSISILTLEGKGKSFTCVTNSSSNNNDNDEFHVFLEALKQIHRKVKMKNNEKDPYAAAAASNKMRGGTMTMKSNQRKTLITPNFSRSNHRDQQQQQQQLLHMTPPKMKQSSGAYLSSNRGNRNNNSNNNDNDDEDYNNDAHNHHNITRGNVLTNYTNTTTTSSPSLHLPPKSPRNATPTKLRRHCHDNTSSSSSSDEETELRKNKNHFTTSNSKYNGDTILTTTTTTIKSKSKLPSRVLFHDSVITQDKKRVKVEKLQRRIEERMLGDRSDDEDEEENVDVEMKKTREDRMEEDEQEEEESATRMTMKKKRRLRKVAMQKSEEEEDSEEEEFDTRTSDETPKWGKKLRLEEDDDDDDEEQVDEGEEKDSPSPAREEKVKKNHGGKTITDSDSSRETSPVTTADKIDDDDDVDEAGGSSTPAVAEDKKPSATKKGPGTIHAFFQPRSASSTSSASKAMSSACTTTPVPPTPVKKNNHLQDHPSTPLTTPSRSSVASSWKSSSSKVETTPIPMQEQVRSLWDKNDATATPKKKSPPSSMFDSSLDSGAYYDRKTPAGGYGTDQDEEDDIYDDDDENTAPALSPIKTTYQQHNQHRGRGIFGQRHIYGQRGYLGRARLNHRNNENYDIRCSRGYGPSEADSAFGRRDLSARMNRADMSKRRLGPFPAVVEDQNDEEKDTKPKIPGIQNLGNTCYLSASLQTLYSIPQFLHKLYKSYEELSVTKDLPLTTALLEVAVTIGALKESDAPMISPDVARSALLSSKAANPSALKKQMDVLTDKFAGYEQRDAHEFLGDLVDFLHDELAENDEAKKKKSEDAPDESAAAAAAAAAVVTTDLPTDEYFHLKVRVCLECKSCGYSRSKEELYRHLSVDVGEDADGESWGVERSLEQFFQAEDRELNCEKCENGTSATQTMEIISRPKAILLHFKRFIVTQKDNGEMVLRKNKAKIPLRDSLSLSSFFSSKEEGPNGLYHLCGVVHHVGNTAFSGHYTTCAKRKLDEESAESSTNVEEQWVFFDDTVGERRTVNYVTGNETNQKNCYMALYEMK